MRTMTLVYAYARATKKVYLAQTYDELETAVRQANLFHNAVESRLSMLERPATQCCPQCEEKQRQIDELNTQRQRDALDGQATLDALNSQIDGLNLVKDMAVKEITKLNGKLDRVCAKLTQAEESITDAYREAKS